MTAQLQDADRLLQLRRHDEALCNFGLLCQLHGFPSSPFIFRYARTKSPSAAICHTSSARPACAMNRSTFLRSLAS